MDWEVRLPYARTLGVVLPTLFGLLAVLTVALPARLSSDTVLAPAALVLWVVWLLWAYPAARFRDGGFHVRNPLRSVWFSASSEVSVTGSSAPLFTVGGKRIRPVVMLISPGGIVDTAHAMQGVQRGVNVVPMSSLPPGAAQEKIGPTGLLQAVCDRAGAVPPAYRAEWNLAGLATTAALLAWTVAALW